MSPLSKNPEEWLEQAEEDLKTAEYMLKGGYNVYAVFFCHLAIEKALKGLYFKRTQLVPPKTHNLLYLLEKINEKPTADIFKFIMTINEVHIITRYPEDYKRIQQEFPLEFISSALTKSRETIKWIKARF